LIKTNGEFEAEKDKLNDKVKELMGELEKEKKESKLQE
jgi:hypothetical protein